MIMYYNVSACDSDLPSYKIFFNICWEITHRVVVVANSLRISNPAKKVWLIKVWNYLDNMHSVCFPSTYSPFSCFCKDIFISFIMTWLFLFCMYTQRYQERPYMKRKRKEEERNFEATLNEKVLWMAGQASLHVHFGGSWSKTRRIS